MELFSEGRCGQELKQNPCSPQPEALEHVSKIDSVPAGKKEESGQSVATITVENEDLGAPKMSTARVAVLLGIIWVSHRRTVFLSLLISSFSDNAHFPTPRRDDDCDPPSPNLDII